MADFPGTPGDDTLNGGADADTISDGGSGNDTLNGNDGDDVITSSGGVDTIDGGAGSDRLIINAFLFDEAILTHGTDGSGSMTSIGSGDSITWSNIENITYTGSPLNDIVTLGNGSHVVNLGSSQDILRVSTGQIFANGGIGSNDQIFFSSSTSGVTFDLGTGAIAGMTLSGNAINFEAVTGSDFGDSLTGAIETNALHGGAGNDLLDSGARVGDLALTGGSGDDIFVVRSGVTPIISDTSGTDRVETDTASFTLPIDIENLEYFGSATLIGTGNSVANVIIGGGMGDTLNGLGGDDTLGGEAGNDLLEGGNGNDRLNGGSGVDTMNGGAGNDILVVNVSGDIASGGDGIDTVQFVTSIFAAYTAQADVENFSSANVFVNATLNALDNIYGGGADQDVIFAGAGNDTLYGRGQADTLSGQDGNDRLFGGDGNDALVGGNGSDFIYGGADIDDINGGADNDTIYGEAGNDRIIGGGGSDLMHGGAGADRFDINSLGETSNILAASDRILDFNQAQGDVINLFGMDANTLVADNQAFTFIGTAAFSAAGQLRYEVANGRTVVSGDVNGDGVGDFFIRLDGVRC